MGYVVLQPFQNPYSLCQLEQDFGIDINTFTEKEKDEYMFNNTGRLAELVKTLEKQKTRSDKNE